MDRRAHGTCSATRAEVDLRERPRPSPRPSTAASQIARPPLTLAAAAVGTHRCRQAIPGHFNTPVTVTRAREGAAARSAHRSLGVRSARNRRAPCSESSELFHQISSIATSSSIGYQVYIFLARGTGVPPAAALKRDVVSRGQRSSAASLEAMTLWWPHYGYETLLPFEGFSRARLFRLLISVCV